MWAGRFKKQLDSEVNDFNSSIRVDCRMYRSDIGGSIAHAAMLGAQGIIEKEDADKIIAGLIVICFALSFASCYIPFIKDMSDGTKTIVLTVLISAGAAILFPRKEEQEAA